MPQCEITAAFMRGIEELFPLKPEETRRQFKTTLGDLMLNLTEWDKVSDVTGSWAAIKVANVLDPVESELHMRMQYALQLGVNQLNVLGGKVVKKHPISLTSPANFEKSLAKLQEELEYYRAVSHIKGDGSLQVTNNLGHAEKVTAYLLEMFQCIGTGRYMRIGYLLAKIFRELGLPKDMALKTARKLLTM